MMGETISPEDERVFFLAEKIEEITVAVGKLADALTPLDDTLDELGDKKTKKGTEGITKMLGGMGLSITPMGMLLDLFSGLLIALEPLMAIWDIMKSWFEIMGAAILPYLMMALKPIMDLFIALSPIFQLVGQIVGMIMQIALIPLTVLFKILGAVLIPLMPLLDPLIKTLDKMSPIINKVTDMIVGLLLSMDFWWGVIIMIKNGLITVFNTVWVAIKGIINGILWIINGFISALNTLITAFGGKALPTFAYLQKGGLVTGPTLAMLGEAGPEKVIPLNDKRANEELGGGSQQLRLLEQNNALLEEMAEMQRNEYRFKRLR